jgi:hypothetical protein
MSESESFDSLRKSLNLVAVHHRLDPHEPDISSSDTFPDPIEVLPSILKLLSDDKDVCIATLEAILALVKQGQIFFTTCFNGMPPQYIGIGKPDDAVRKTILSSVIPAVKHSDSRVRTSALHVLSGFLDQGWRPNNVSSIFQPSIRPGFALDNHAPTVLERLGDSEFDVCISAMRVAGSWSSCAVTWIYRYNISALFSFTGRQ